ncbi:MAG: iron-sulfur cluster insertion protein ErpA [Gammaproteobacteria bacterium]
MASYNAASSVQSAQLLFCNNAVAKVNELIREEGDLDLNLRVYISGGGCSGFQYGFTFDKTINPDDTVIEKRVEQEEEEDDGGGGGGDTGRTTVKLLVDALSIQYLIGAEIDYRDDLNGEQFIIRNPNAKTTCGCGSSFSI